MLIGCWLSCQTEEKSQICYLRWQHVISFVCLFMLVKLWRRQMYFPVHPMPANICNSKTSGFWTPSGWSSQSCGTLTLQEYHPAGSLNLQHDLSLYGVVSSAWHSSSSSPGTHPHNAYTSKYTQINATSTIRMTPHCLSFSLSVAWGQLISRWKTGLQQLLRRCKYCLPQCPDGK